MTTAMQEQLEGSTPHILSQTPDALIRQIGEMGQPAFRARQLVDWLFQKRISDPDRMSNLPASFRTQLRDSFDWSLPGIVSRLDSEDGASKLLLRDAKGMQFEAVILRYEGRTSLCVSSQVGCKLACRFCQTGKLGFFRHLRADEIIAQFMLANQLLESEERRISHVVFMGMGEPLDNPDSVLAAVRLLTSPDAFGLSYRRVTVSTSGLVPGIMRLADKSLCSLAVSLHAARDELRTELMPVNRKYPLAELKEALLFWQKQTGQRITIEYILIRDKNATRREAKELVRFLHGLRAKVNLIPFNPHPGLEYQRPALREIEDFQSYLSARGYPSPVRYSKGMEVSAACGQLAAKHQESIFSAPLRRNVVTASGLPGTSSRLS
ncbi:MAG: 23S rRNA (adenine(2503)-C(2))-methyltransferase RlmN [Deltaproteobacteria bacterium]|nr:23S rRNA (adenine(2503)-C(2))-methyltransferase RlmN [Deltaproteobacteria bacterium]